MQQPDQTQTEVQEPAAFDRNTVRAVLAMFTPHGEDFYYNHPNNYGAVKLTLWTGKGDPWDQLRGAEIMADFVDGRRGNGSYRLNERAVDLVMHKLQERQKQGLPERTGEERDAAPQKVTLTLFEYDDEFGFECDTTMADVSVKDVSEIVDHAAQAIRLRREGKDHGAVLDKLDAALTTANVITPKRRDY